MNNNIDKIDDKCINMNFDEDKKGIKCANGRLITKHEDDPSKKRR